MSGRRDKSARFAVGVHDKNYFLVVHGVLPASLPVRMIVMEQKGDWITGVPVDDRARLWLSVRSNYHSI